MAIRTQAMTVDDRVLRRRMDDLVKDQIPFAMSLAINDLSKDVARVQRFELQTTFDRPTPFVQRGIRRIKGATKRDPEALVSGQGGRREFQSAYARTVQRILAPHIEGSARRRRPSERRLVETGQIGPGQWLIGAEAFPARDRYGNVPGPVYQQMLSFFRAYRGLSRSGKSITGLNRAMGRRFNTRGWRYFIQKAGSGLGIYRVRGRAGKPQLVFIVTGNRPDYPVRFDFYGIAQRHSDRYASYFAERAMHRALATAR